jgi:hypothetical protein
MARAQQTRFQPVFLPERRSGRNRFRVGRRIIYWTLAVVVGLDALLLLLGPDGALWRRAAKSDITQQVSVTIQEINPKTNTIRVVGDLVGIMGMDVVVPPQTWIGIDRQLVVFGQLRDGLRANISFVRHGEQRVARWIAATSAKVSEIKPTEAGAAPVATPVGASSPAR